MPRVWFNNNYVLVTASSKTLSFFNKDTRGEVQTVTFDTDEVKTLFYGSFHKVKTKLSFFIERIWLKNLNW